MALIDRAMDNRIFLNRITKRMFDAILWLAHRQSKTGKHKNGWHALLSDKHPPLRHIISTLFPFEPTKKWPNIVNNYPYYYPPSGVNYCIYTEQILKSKRRRQRQTDRYSIIVQTRQPQNHPTERETARISEAPFVSGEGGVSPNFLNVWTDKLPN